MPLEQIALGTTAGDGTGEGLRSGGLDINANFAILAAASFVTITDSTLDFPNSVSVLANVLDGQLLRRVGSTVVGIDPATGGAVAASVVTYDPTASGMTATDVQAAIDELDAAIAAGGEANTASNLGAGAGVFASKVGDDLQFKTLTSAGATVTITPAANTINLEAVASGEVNTASNMGSGTGVFGSKVGSDLRFKTLTSASGTVTLTQTSSEINLETSAGASSRLELSSFGASSGLTPAQNAAILDTAIATLSGNSGVIYIGKGIQVDYDAAAAIPLRVVIHDEELPRYIVGRVGLEPGAANPGHITFRSSTENQISQHWIMPRGYPDAGINDQPAAVKVFHHDYEIGAESGVFDYTDGGLTAHYAASGGGFGWGLIFVNTKTNGNFLPFRPVGGLTLQGGQDVPLRWMFIPSEPAVAGNFFTGGGMYMFPANKGLWRTGVTYAQGELCSYDGRIFEAQAAGTTGATEPTHVTGTVSDGGINWLFLADIKPTRTANVMRPIVMIGHKNDVPWTGAPFATHVLHVTQDAAVYYQKKLGFANVFGDEIAINVYRDDGKLKLVNDVSGVDRWIDIESHNGAGSGGANLRVRGDSVQVLNKPLRLATAVKPDTQTTLDVSAGNMFSCNDLTPTNLTGFTGGLPGQVVFVRFNTGNTTLVHSANLQVGGVDLTPAASTCRAFLTIGGTAWTMIGVG